MCVKKNRSQYMGVFGYPVARGISTVSRIVSEELRLEREMACYLMGLADVVELWFCGGVDAFIRPAPRLVDRTAWGKPAAAVRTIEIKYPPIGRLTP